MSRKKKYQAADVTGLEFWNSGTDDGTTTAYCRTGRELLFHPRYVGLSESAKGIYLLMRCSCGGNRNDWFALPYSEAKRAGYAERTFRRAVDELEKAGFLEIELERRIGDRSKYRFTGKWKSVF